MKTVSNYSKVSVCLATKMGSVPFRPFPERVRKITQAYSECCEGSLPYLVSALIAAVMAVRQRAECSSACSAPADCPPYTAALRVEASHTHGATTRCTAKLCWNYFAVPHNDWRIILHFYPPLFDPWNTVYAYIAFICLTQKDVLTTLKYYTNISYPQLILFQILHLTIIIPSVF